MDNLNHYIKLASSTYNENRSNKTNSSIKSQDHSNNYASKDFVLDSSSSCKWKKDVPWMKEEHKMLLLGLKKLGKGD